VVSSLLFSPGFVLPLVYRTLFASFLLFSAAAQAVGRVQAVPVPQDMRSTAFTVRVNGRVVDVAHAAASYEFVSFDITAAATV